VQCVSRKAGARSHPCKTVFEQVSGSLVSLAGREYVEAACRARAALSGEAVEELMKLAEDPVEFYPPSYHARLLRLLPETGQFYSRPAKASSNGATSDDFRAHSNKALAPLSCMGYFRVAEDGRLFLTAKSAHYHAPLGHDFPGYRLLEHGRRLGIANATHNNFRGHITRLLEERLVCRAGGIAWKSAGSGGAADELLASKRATDLNRVLNLETGSLAAEAALKMLLARFYKIQPGSPAPKYQGRTPVIAVLGDDHGAISANYHGTAVLTQMMRGMWPEILGALEQNNVLLVRPVRPNDLDGLEGLFREYETGRFKIAGFFHELVMMNYGARALSQEFVARLYALCEQYDVPSVADEIQTCVWSPQIFMFREYGVKPNIVVLGKGFPGGEYAASRVLFSAAMDTLPQFGALVTNGQEELASLAYLITLEWAECNAQVTAAVGEYYEGRLNDLTAEFPHLIASIEGRRHMAGVHFVDLAPAQAFTRHLQEAGIDISVQVYKDGCPPTALTKLPLTVGYEVVDFIVDRMRDALKRI